MEEEEEEEEDASHACPVGGGNAGSLSAKKKERNYRKKKKKKFLLLMNAIRRTVKRAVSHVLINTEHLMKKMKIGTHNGTFHCDEVLACFFLRQLPEFKVHIHDKHPLTLLCDSSSEGA